VLAAKEACDCLGPLLDYASRVGGQLRFEFAFARAYRVAARPFGVTPSNSWVEVGAGNFEVSAPVEDSPLSAG